MATIFSSVTDEEMPLLTERLACLREAGLALHEVGRTLRGRSAEADIVELR